LADLAEFLYVTFEAEADVVVEPPVARGEGGPHERWREAAHGDPVDVLLAGGYRGRGMCSGNGVGEQILQQVLVHSGELTLGQRVPLPVG